MTSILGVGVWLGQPWPKYGLSGTTVLGRKKCQRQQSIETFSSLMKSPTVASDLLQCNHANPANEAEIWLAICTQACMDMYVCVGCSSLPAKLWQMGSERGCMGARRRRLMHYRTQAKAKKRKLVSEEQSPMAGFRLGGRDIMGIMLTGCF